MCIDKSTIDSDLFCEMPLSTQALYFHLVCNANDNNSVFNAHAIARGIKASPVDLDILIDRGFIVSETHADGFSLTKIMR